MRKLLLTALLLTAVTAIAVNVWYRIGLYPLGTHGFVEGAYGVFSYARLVAIPVAVFAFLSRRGGRWAPARGVFIVL